MTTQFTATIIDGILRPDEPIGLPNHSRVNVMISPVADAKDSLAALHSIQQRLKLRPVHTDGRRFTRDELHERH